MLSVVYTTALNGIDGFTVAVECNISAGLSRFDVVGLPDMAVKEARERIRAAVVNSGFAFPDEAVVVNLAPADRRKEGASYDLAIAVGLLASAGAVSRRKGGDYGKLCFVGELGLSGEIRPVKGALCMCIAARDTGLTEIFVPTSNAAEAAAVGGMTVYGAGSLGEIISHLNGEKRIGAAVYKPAPEAVFDGLPDFSEVKGQERAKRACEIAAAGGHNILLIGPPGTGKSMIAKRLPSILPPMTFEESLETTKVYSVAGLLDANSPAVVKRPFRSPHHTASAVSLTGGGKVPSPGEISLSHNGVLFLDELPEFARPVTESLRQPLEDGRITIARATGRLTFPATFMLVCAMNPCRCGYFGHPSRPCVCRAEDIKKYMSKLSGPLLDRIDIQIEVPPLSFEEMSQIPSSEPSSAIRERVGAARKIAAGRFGAEKIYSNSAMTPVHIKKYCRLGPASSSLMKEAFEKMKLSARSYDRILRVARTIADLAGSIDIETEHVAEAVQLRSLDRKYQV